MLAQLFLGEDLLAWLVLAFGAAMALGTAAALIRPPAERRGRPDREGSAREKPSLGLSVALMVMGTVAAVWALATLLS
ncbi:MAG: hypothetical protein JJLCMIEE_00401 [Acidimicrobiales bacterium]|nr:MAG: hypothetical protein EDR02_13865 [Actinomycetota bacterium]MBV6507357.1 hypothetical protein [Acidimicrobiales bacterium]RIK04486.1 MAG: hypothetical protein DCC48_13240 [Acidobacteriota bacterium]